MRKHSITEVTVKCKPHMEVSHAGITKSRQIVSPTTRSHMQVLNQLIVLAASTSVVHSSVGTCIISSQQYKKLVLNLGLLDGCSLFDLPYHSWSSPSYGVWGGLVHPWSPRLLHCCLIPHITQLVNCLGRLMCPCQDLVMVVVRGPSSSKMNLF